MLCVGEIFENSDGSAEIEFKYDGQFTKDVRSHYNRKRCTTKLIRRFIEEAIHNSYKEWDD